MADPREQNLKKLEQIFQLLDNSLTREEFVTFAEQLTKRILDARKRTEDATALIEKIVSTLPKKVNDDTAKALKTIEKQIADLRTAALVAFDGKMKEVDQKLSTIKDGEKGDKGDKGDAGDIKDLSPEEIRNALELLQGDERLDISAVKGFDLSQYAKKGEIRIIGHHPRGKIQSYDLSSSLDGSTKTFNLPAIWGVISVACSSTPGILRPTIDYTWTPTSITFTSQITAATTLAAGQTVIITYEEA